MGFVHFLPKVIKLVNDIFHTSVVLVQPHSPSYRLHTAQHLHSLQAEIEVFIRFSKLYKSHMTKDCYNSAGVTDHFCIIIYRLILVN